MSEQSLGCEYPEDSANGLLWANCWSHAFPPYWVASAGESELRGCLSSRTQSSPWPHTHSPSLSSHCASPECQSCSWGGKVVQVKAWPIRLALGYPVTPAHLSKEMFLVSSCVVTTGAVSLLRTCSSEGWAAASSNSRSCPARARVSMYTTRRSWSISMTTALVSATREQHRGQGGLGLPAISQPALLTA